MTFINLTSQAATPRQIQEGVTSLGAKERKSLAQLLHFVDLPSITLLKYRAEGIANLAATANASSALIAGEPFFMPILEASLRKQGITPYYAVTLPIEVDVVDEDGVTVKVPSVKHLGFVEGVVTATLADLLEFSASA